MLPECSFACASTDDALVEVIPHLEARPAAQWVGLFCVQDFYPPAARVTISMRVPAPTRTLE